MHSLKIFIGSYFPSLILPPVDHSKVWPFMDTFFYLLQETGYFHLQATKPDTVGRGPGQKEVMDIITIWDMRQKRYFGCLFLIGFPSWTKCYSFSSNPIPFYYNSFSDSLIKTKGMFLVCTQTCPLTTKEGCGVLRPSLVVTSLLSSCHQQITPRSGHSWTLSSIFYKRVVTFIYKLLNLILLVGVQDKRK